MDFALSDEQQLLQSTVENALEANCSLDVVREAVDRDVTCVNQLLEEFSEIGIPGLLVPQEFGGVGLGLLDAALVAESLGAYAAPYPFLAPSVMAVVALTASSSDEQKHEWLPRIASGEVQIGVAVADFTGRRDSDGIHTHGARLRGQTMFAFDANGAKAFIVADSHGQLHIVDTSELAMNPLKTIDRTRSMAELVLDNAEAQPIPTVDETCDPLRQMIAVGRIMISADTLGAAQTMLDKAVAYARERKQFNRVIGSFQAVKHMCSEMAAELEPCRSLVWYAAHCFDAIPAETSLYACHAKAHLSDVGRFVARTATEVHGGMGFTDLLGLHYWFKRIELNRQLLGTPEFVRNEAAELQGWTS